MCSLNKVWNIWSAKTKTTDRTKHFFISIFRSVCFGGGHCIPHDHIHQVGTYCSRSRKTPPKQTNSKSDKISTRRRKSPPKPPKQTIKNLHQVGTYCSRTATTPTLSLNSPVRGSEAQVGFFRSNKNMKEAGRRLWQQLVLRSSCKVNERLGFELLTHSCQISVSTKLPSFILQQNFHHRKNW